MVPVTSKVIGAASAVAAEMASQDAPARRIARVGGTSSPGVKRLAGHAPLPFHS